MHFNYFPADQTNIANNLEPFANSPLTHDKILSSVPLTFSLAVPLKKTHHFLLFLSTLHSLSQNRKLRAGYLSFGLKLQKARKLETMANDFTSIFHNQSIYSIMKYIYFKRSGKHEITLLLQVSPSLGC